MTDLWHRRLGVSDTHFARRCADENLAPVEREILAALLSEHLGLIPEFRRVGNLLDFLTLPGVRNKLKAARTLADQGSLVQKNLVVFEDPENDLANRRVSADPGLVEAVLNGGGFSAVGLAAQTEEDLLDHLYGYMRLMVHRVEVIRSLGSGYGRRRDLLRVRHRVAQFLQDLQQTLDLHPSWKLAEIRNSVFCIPRGAVRDDEGWQIFLVLLGKEAGLLDADDRLFTGEGLACPIADSEVQIQRMVGWVGHHACERWDWLRPCGGNGFVLDDSAEALGRAEYELTDDMVDAVGLPRQARRRWTKTEEVREAVVSFEQLVFPADVLESLDLLVAQAKRGQVLFEEWQLKETLRYGRGMTGLLWGPPGVGKTAAAEAVANAIRRPIMIVNYAEVQNCYVGNTEKNIARAFRTAERQGAVLFWDECDAMLYNRDAATHTWERRAVNVVLQELERFEGVCLLATNRPILLDEALERRITLKIEVRRPGKAQRRAILAKLIPAALPLADDADLDALSEPNLTGGQLKNVILNASRLALLHTDGRGPVLQAHFLQAIEAELKGRLHGGTRRPIGFAPVDPPSAILSGASFSGEFGGREVQQ
jgi:hypothetical protein